MAGYVKIAGFFNTPPGSSQSRGWVFQRLRELTEVRILNPLDLMRSKREGDTQNQPRDRSYKKPRVPNRPFRSLYLRPLV